jgi:hypothetical protein
MFLVDGAFVLAYVPERKVIALRKIAVTLSVLAAAASLSGSAQAAAGPPDVREILDGLIVCVTEPCP